MHSSSFVSGKKKLEKQNCKIWSRSDKLYNRKLKELSYRSEKNWLGFNFDGKDFHIRYVDQFRMRQRKEAVGWVVVLLSIGIGLIRSSASSI